ncbi:MAG TPA: hypothetical protein VD811_16635 [Desulfuromonadales bacterium]|nr:hypothetical protein [Desulfuromonadales bacterium]
MVMTITTVMQVGEGSGRGKLAGKRESKACPATCAAARIGLNRNGRQVMIDP